MNWGAKVLDDGNCTQLCWRTSLVLLDYTPKLRGVCRRVMWCIEDLKCNVPCEDATQPSLGQYD
jgi:hypothetical protein